MNAFTEPDFHVCVRAWVGVCSQTLLLSQRVVSHAVNTGLRRSAIDCRHTRRQLVSWNVFCAKIWLTVLAPVLRKNDSATSLITRLSVCSTEIGNKYYRIGKHAQNVHSYERASCVRDVIAQYINHQNTSCTTYLYVSKWESGIDYRRCVILSLASAWEF